MSTWMNLRSPGRVEVAGVPVAEAGADGEHHVGLEEDRVAEALRGLQTDDPGLQRAVLGDRALAHSVGDTGMLSC